MGILWIGAVVVTAGAVLAQTPARAAATADSGNADPAATAGATAAELRAAERVARPVFQQQCSRCHGADGRGMRSQGAPNLVDAVWLWDDGTADSPLAALADTLRYGIRSGHPKARNVTAMPAFAQGGELALTPGEIADVVEYVLALSGQQVDPAARKRGRALYAGKGQCAECHGDDGSGNPDWGAANLRIHEDSAWVYGNDRTSVTQTISVGRAGSCPAWVDHLPPATITALAVWLRSGSARPGP